jgi:hypothetical protein
MVKRQQHFIIDKRLATTQSNQINEKECRIYKKIKNENKLG